MDETSGQHPGTDTDPSALESEIKQLRERHQARFEHLSSLMSSLQGLSEDVRQESDSLDALEQSAQGQMTDLKKTLESAAVMSNLEAQVAELTRALETSERERTAEAERAREAEERLHAVEAETSNQGDEATQLRDELQGVRNELENRDTALQAAQSALDAAREEQAQVAEELEHLKNAHQQAEATQEGLRTELLSVQRELESVREQYRDGLDTDAAVALRQQVADMAEEVASLGQQLSEAQSKGLKSALAQQLTEAIRESERLEEENLNLKQQLRAAGTSHAIRELERPDLVTVEATANAPQVSRSGKDELQRIRESASQWTNSGPKRVIGQILLDAEVITAEQLETALELQKSNPQQHLGSLLAELGFASDEAIAQARASQCGVAYIRFEETTVDPAAAALITERLASQHNCIPISATSDNLVLAVINPMDLLAIEDVERFTNRKVEVVVGTGPEIATAISRYYWEPE